MIDLKDEIKEMLRIDVDLVKTENRDVIHTIVSLYYRLNKLQIELEEAKKLEKKLLMELQTKKLEVDEYKHMVDVLSAKIADLETKYAKALETIEKQRTMENVWAMKYNVVEKMLRELLNTINMLLEKARTTMTKTERELIYDEIEKNINLAFKRAIETLSMAQAMKGGEAETE